MNNNKDCPAFTGLLWSKGTFWLAARPSQHGEWSQASGMLTLQGGGSWFTVVPRGIYLAPVSFLSFFPAGKLIMTDAWPADERHCQSHQD